MASVEDLVVCEFDFPRNSCVDLFQINKILISS